MKRVAGKSPWNRLRRVAVCGLVLISVKVFAALLLEYRWYFPPDFDQSSFLSGRRFSFDDHYRTAFYAHLIAGPIALGFGTFLLVSGCWGRWPAVHRYLGRAQGVLVLGLLVPTGLWMATKAYAGPVAAIGFASLSMATGLTLMLAIAAARAGRMVDHQRWAKRCYLLLWSPLFLRALSGVFIATGLESDFLYRVNAWISWLLPLAVFEFWARRTEIMRRTSLRYNDVRFPSNFPEQLPCNAKNQPEA
ncbi:MAG: DUF2306 domain-containing protein [Planctomycetota bacterium]